MSCSKKGLSILQSLLFSIETENEDEKKRLEELVLMKGAPQSSFFDELSQMFIEEEGRAVFKKINEACPSIFCEM